MKVQFYNWNAPEPMLLTDLNREGAYHIGGQQCASGEVTQQGVDEKARSLHRLSLRLCSRAHEMHYVPSLKLSSDAVQPPDYREADFILAGCSARRADNCRFFWADDTP